MEQIDYNNIIYKLINLLEGRNLKEKTDALADLLKLSVKSIYNKLSGRSRFSIEELIAICIHYNISLDSLIHACSPDLSYAPFYGDGLKYTPRTYEEYFMNVNKYFTQIRLYENVHGYFLANEVPFFHLLNLPQILYMKLYMWNHFNWKIPNISAHYDPKMLLNNPKLLNVCKYSYDLFCSFESTEIWNPHFLDNIITQFENLVKLDVISDKETIQEFKKELSLLITKLETYTETGLKPENSKGKLYKSNIYVTDLHLGSEIILVKSDKVDILFQQIDIPNYLRSSSPNVINRIFQFYNSSLRKSTYITGTGEIIKSFFFKNLRNKVNLILPNI